MDAVSRMGRIKNKQIPIPEATLLICLKIPAFRKTTMGRTDDEEGYTGHSMSLSMIKGEITDEHQTDSEYDIDLEDEMYLGSEDPDRWMDYVGDTDEIDSEIAATPNQMFGGKSGGSEFGIEYASEDDEEEEGYGTETSYLESDCLDEEYDSFSQSPEEKRTRSTMSPRIEVMVDEDDESLAEQIRTLDPDHHLNILSTLLNHLANPRGFTHRLCINYERFVKAYGPQNIRNEILQALDADIRELLDQRGANLESLKACTKRDAKACDSAGAYMHVMYNPNDSDNTGVYIGTGNRISERIQKHVKGRKHKMSRRRAFTMHSGTKKGSKISG